MTAPPATTLTERQLNRALLARQLLLARSSAPLTAVLEQAGGLQTQYAPSGYIGLWTRMRAFARADLTRALYDRRAVQGTIMRGTIHTVAAADYWPLTIAVRRHRREWFARVQAEQIGNVDMEQVARAARDELAAGPLAFRELSTRLVARGLPERSAGWVGFWVELVRVPPSGTWERRRADLYGLADDWLPALPLTEDDALDHLARRYLGGFGPARLTDMASWAGVPAAALRPVVERLELRRLRDEQGRELIDLPDAALPDATTPAPVHFLPSFDATLFVHARRTQILPERFRPIVFSIKAPQSFNTFLVDGQVAGTWRYRAGSIELSPFEPLPRRAADELDEEAARLAGLYDE